MQQVFSSTTDPALQVGQSLFTLSFSVGDTNLLFVTISGQLQYPGVSYDMPTPNQVRFRFRLRGTETVEFFRVGSDGSGTILDAWIASPSLFREAAELPRPDRPTLS